jgi:hypothetical protein
VDVRDYALEQHALTHAAAVSESATPTAVDRLVRDLGEAQFRARPAPGLNSLAWLLWHMARLEDAAMNALVAGTPQVIEGDGWPDRLGLSGAALGTGMDDAEVASVSERVVLPALLDYRNTVGRRTRAIIAGLHPERLDAPVDSARVTDLVHGSGAAAWLDAALQGRPLRFFLAMPASGHSFLHLGEAWCVRTLLGAGGGR